MSTSIWSPQGSIVTQVNVKGLLKSEVITPGIAQTTLTLTAFTYAVGTESIFITKNGKIINRSVDYFEVGNAGSNGTSVTLSTPTVLGDVFVIFGFVGISGSTTVDPVLRADLLASGGTNIITHKRNAIGTINQKLFDRLNDLEVTVKEFGAIGNKVRDDYASIQAACDYVEGLGGGTVVVPYTGKQYRITDTIRLGSHVRLYFQAPTRYPYSNVIGLFADFANPNKWVIESKATINGNPIAYNDMISEGENYSFVYNCTIENCQISIGAVVPYGAIRMQGAPGSIVSNCSAVGTGTGILVNFSFGGNYSFHGITKYYGCVNWDDVNANNFEIYCTQEGGSNFTKLVPDSYLMPFMASLNGSLVLDYKLSTNAHYNRTWGYVIGSLNSTSNGNRIDMTLEGWSGNVFQFNATGNLWTKNYGESANSVTDYYYVGAQTKFRMLGTHAYSGLTGVLFDIGVSTIGAVDCRGLISVAGLGTVYKDNTTLITLEGISPEAFSTTPPQFNVIYSDYSTDWKVPTLFNSWVGAGAPNATLGYRLNSRTGNVEFQGALVDGVVGQVAFILPNGYKPLGKKVFLGAGGQFTVLGTGEVIPTVPTATFVYLDGASYLAEQ